MLKFKTKLLLFFLMNAFFLCISTGFAVVYIEKLSISIENISSLRKAAGDIAIHSEDFSKIAHSYGTVSPEKHDLLRSSIDFSISHFENAMDAIESDSNLQNYVLTIKSIRDQYLNIANKISSNRRSFSEQYMGYSETLSELKAIRYKLIELSASLSADARLPVVEAGYNEKEFNFQYEDSEHSDKWLASMKELLNVASKEGSEEFSNLANSYAKIAERSVAEKNSLIDLDLNYGYYLAKIDNISIENRIQNTKITSYIDQMIDKIQKNSVVFKFSSIIFIFLLLFFGSMAMIVYSRKITDSISELMNVSKKITDGDLSIRSNIGSNDEIGSLANTFNKMLDSIDKNNEELREESAQMKAMVSSMGEGLLVIDKENNIIIANEKAATILRIPYQDLIKKNLKKLIRILINTEERPPEKWPVDDVIRSGESLTIRSVDGYYLKSESGKVIPVEITIAPLASKKVNRIVIIFKDITEAKLIEEEREFSRQNLESVLKSIYIERDNVQEEKTKLEALLNSIGDAVLATDENKQVIAFNPIAQKITGSTFDELEGEYFDKYINFVDEETRKVKNDFIDKVLKNEQRIELNNLALINKKGHLILIDIDASPIKNGRGDIIGCIIIFKDVTEKREADRMRTDFISIVSHQLRTPLSAMKWFLEILIDGDVGVLKPKQKDIINDIHDSNKGMIDFVNQMLNVSRIESKRLAINPEKLNLNKALKELLKESDIFLKEKQQKLNYRFLEEENLQINVDKNLLRNILSSLVLNASRYTQRNGNIEIEISRYDKNYILFKIKDDGIGIPESEHEKIFKKFSRASNAIRFEANGTGLGLYIVKSIVNMVCGKIWFESHENKGSTFYFTLPIENMVCEIEEGNNAKPLM